MLFFISLILAGVVVLAGANTLKRHPYPWFAAAFCLSLFVSLYPFSDTLATAADLLRRGTLAAALWCIVMWIGALSSDSRLFRKLSPIRGELSILAAALTLSHIISSIASGVSRSDPMTAGQLMGSLIGKFLTILMILLALLSFPGIRRFIKAKKWKQLQRFAYLFYALLYFHILLMFLPPAQNGQEGYYLSVLLYTAVFLGYAICRLRKWYFLRRNPLHKKQITSVCMGIYLVLMVLFAAFACHPAFHPAALP